LLYTLDGSGGYHQESRATCPLRKQISAEGAGIGAIRARLEAIASVVTERPDPFAALDRFFAAATIAHEYVADLHRELGALGADSAHTRAPLGESAAIVTERMPALTRELRQQGDEWETQNLLDPPRAKRTLQLAETRLIEVEPELSTLRARQDAIVAEVQGLLERARGS
jgi:hypothetical protein